jgi:flagellin-like hook-associated protein FlgL
MDVVSMLLSLGINLASLNAQRRLQDASSALSRTYERLSSGQRINRASDDSAGSAIAESLKTQGRIYTQSIRNANDGISLLSIADAANSALSDIVSRISELATQAANESYSDAQRDALDEEAQALSTEYVRILKSTKFNGSQIFDGSLDNGLRLQLGSTNDGINISVGESVSTLEMSISSTTGTGTFGIATTFTTESNVSYDVEFGDLNGDGILDMVSAGQNAGSDGYANVRLGIGDGTFASSTSYSTEGNTSYDLELADLNGDGFLDLITAGRNDGWDGYATVRLGAGDGTFGAATTYSTEDAVSKALQIGDVNGDGFLDMITSGYNNSSQGYATIRLGVGDGTFGASVSYSAEATYSQAVTLGDLNGDGFLDLVTAGSGAGGGKATVRLGNGDGTFGASTSYTAETNNTYTLDLGDLNGDGFLDLITGGRSVNGYATVRLGVGDGTFGAATQFSTSSGYSRKVEVGDLNGDGYLDLISTGYETPGRSTTTIRLGDGNGSFGSVTSYSTRSGYGLGIADLNSDGAVDIVVVGQATGGQAIISLGITQTINVLQTLSLQSQEDAVASMEILSYTLESLALQKGEIGASLSRVGIAVESLYSQRDNLLEAESRIRDVDVASEAAELLRYQIVQNAASSILAQANQQTALVLQLLED